MSFVVSLSKYYVMFTQKIKLFRIVLKGLWCYHVFHQFINMKCVGVAIHQMLELPYTKHSAASEYFNWSNFSNDLELYNDKEYRSTEAGDGGAGAAQTVGEERSGADGPELSPDRTPTNEGPSTPLLSGENT